jgi:hypothetical protein
MSSELEQLAPAQHMLDLHRALQPMPSIEATASMDETPGPKLTMKHHRRNSTVQEQRAQRVKAVEMERMLSLPRVRPLPLNTHEPVAVGAQPKHVMPYVCVIVCR